MKLYKTHKNKETRKNKTIKIFKKNDLMNGVYTENEYNSNDGMLTAVWGPPMWHYLHTMSFNYPVNPTKKDKKHYMNFVLSLRWVLPCGKCRKNLVNNFSKLPLEMKHMKNRETFSKYIYDLHELVNTMLNKKSGLTYEVIRERYEHFRARCLKNKKITLKKNEKGCVVPYYGKKSKCILKIVPNETKVKTLEIDETCVKKLEVVE